MGYRQRGAERGHRQGASVGHLGRRHIIRTPRRSGGDLMARSLIAPDAATAFVAGNDQATHAQSMRHAAEQEMKAAKRRYKSGELRGDNQRG